MDIFRTLLEIGKSKCVKNHRGLDESMKILDEKLKDLNLRKTNIESKIGVEPLSNQTPMEVVVHWLEKVQNITDDKKLENEVAKGILSRARLRMRAARNIREVEDLLEQGLMFVFVTTTTLLAPVAKVSKATSKCVEEIWKSLISDDVLKIGVWGMGGSGKTTIIKHIFIRVLEPNDKFDNVHWITVSMNTSVIKLQDSIASALELQYFEEVEDEVDRAAMLYKKLKEEKRWVLIFDDVYEAFDLQEVGIPEPTINNGCKLILTTRSNDVCQRMNCKDIRIELLSNDEAWYLFLEKAALDLSRSPGLEAIAKQVAEECAGLPLAIVAVGTSMRGIVDKHEWRHALKMLREGTKGVREMSKVIESLKYSYTRLNDEQAQHCLLYCALYPEDSEIERNELIACLIAEEIIEGMESREDGFDAGHIILNKLENACLLQGCSTYDFETDDMKTCVKMHDVIRDMALQIRGSGSMVECGVQSIEFPTVERWNDNLETVSLMGTGIREIPVDAAPRCSRLKTLRLSKSSMLTRLPDSLFVHMPSLCVLDLSHTEIEILPNSISELENLTALLLRSRSVEFVPSLAKLRKLRVLDLCDTSIKQVPEGMEMLVNLQYLNIDGIWAETFPTEILPNLIRLQFFSALSPTDGLEIKGEELMGLKNLETLACRLSSLDDLNSYISYLQTHHQRLPKCYILRVGLHGDLSVLDESKNSKSIQVGFFKGEEAIVQLPDNIKEISIYAYELNGGNRLPFVQGELWFKVEVLKFEDLGNLRVLVDRTQLLSHGTTFSILTELRVILCPKLKHLFKLELVQYFPNLESIFVRDCSEMKELVAVEEEEEEEEESDELSIVNDVTITLPMLRSLILYKLPELKSIICRKGIMVCDSIEEINIYKCPKLKRLPLYLPLSSNGQPSPPAALKVIYVEDEGCWDSLEWDNPIAKDVLQPLVKYIR